MNTPSAKALYHDWMEIHVHEIQYAFGCTALLYAIANVDRLKINWPSLASPKIHNLTGWLSMGVAWGALAILGGYLSRTDSFDRLLFLDVVSKLASFLGFLTATYFVLAPSKLRIFLGEFAPHVVAWMLMGGTLGLACGGFVSTPFDEPHASDIANVGLSGFFLLFPVISVMQLSGRRSLQLAQ